MGQSGRFEATGESGCSHQGDVQVVWDDFIIAPDGTSLANRAAAAEKVLSALRSFSIRPSLQHPDTGREVDHDENQRRSIIGPNVAILTRVTNPYNKETFACVTNISKRTWRTTLCFPPLTRRQFAAASVGAGVVVMLPRAADAQAVKESDVEIKTPDGVADAYFVHPASGAHAAVLVWPDIMGLRPAFRQMGKRLAESGYAVLVVNQFYRPKKHRWCRKARALLTKRRAISSCHGQDPERNHARH